MPGGWPGGVPGAVAGWPGGWPGGRVAGRRSEEEASPVRESCVPGPRNVPGPATPERPKGRLPSPVPEKSADRGRKSHGPGTLVWDRGRKSRGPATEKPRTGDKNPTPSPARRRSWYPPSRLPSPALRPQKTQTCGGGCPAPSYRTFSSHPTPRTPGASR